MGFLEKLFGKKQAPARTCSAVIVAAGRASRM